MVFFRPFGSERSNYLKVRRYVRLTCESRSADNLSGNTSSLYIKLIFCRARGITAGIKREVETDLFREPPDTHAACRKNVGVRPDGKTTTIITISVKNSNENLLRISNQKSKILTKIVKSFSKKNYAIIISRGNSNIVRE